MRKILISLYIIQEVSNKERHKKGLKRLNPYNPLSYITIVLILVIGIIMFGFVGFWKEVDIKNPFKWN